MPPSTGPTQPGPTPPGDEKLSNRQYVIVILRLLLDEGSQLVHGEVVDAAGQLHGRFRDWRGMSAAVRKWFTDYRERNAPR